MFLYIAVITLICALFSGNFVRLGNLSFKILAILSISVFIAGFWNRISVWTKGSGDMNGSSIAREALTGAFSKECFAAYRLFQKSRVRGVVLALTIWSFLALAFGSSLLSLEYILKTDLTSSAAFSMVMDYSGLVLLLCVIFYIARRVMVKSARSIAVMDDIALLITFILIVLSGFAVEGFRIAYAGIHTNPDSPVGVVIAKIILNYFSEPVVLLKVKDIAWKLHAFIVFFFFGYIPFSKQFHMFAAQIVTRDAEKRKKDLWGIVHE